MTGSRTSSSLERLAFKTGYYLMNKATDMRRIKLTLVLLAFFVFSSTGLCFAKAKVAILPWKVNAAGNVDFLKDALADMLSSRVGSGEAAEVMRADIVKSAISEVKAGEVATDVSALAVGAKLKADYVLYGSLTVLGSAISLDAKFLNVKDGVATPFYSKGDGMDSVVGLVDKLSFDVNAVLSPAPVAPVQAAKAVQAPVVAQTPVAQKPPAGFIVPAPVAVPVPVQQSSADNDFIVKPKEGAVKPLLWKSELIEGQFVAMITADLNKEGVKKVFLVKQTAVVIAKIAEKKLDVIQEITLEKGVKNVAVTVMDSDGDGAQEVYVSAIKDNKPYSYVIEFKDNGYKVTVTDVKWLMRSVNYKGSQALIGQAFRKPDGFYGPLRVLKKRGGEVVDSGNFEITLPRSIDIYRFDTFTSAGQTMLVALDNRNYLKLFKSEKAGKWEEVLKSVEYFGGSINFVEFTEDDRPVQVDADPVPVEGKFYIVDSGGQGKLSLIIKRNVPGGLGRYARVVRTFTSGYVLNLSMNENEGGFLNENWRTKEVTGYMADFLIDDLDGTQKLYMLMVEGAGLFSGNIKSYILSTKVSL
ncbi:hypothetical protein EPN18_02730 [bacterium]|nr:MAG: hypothetical protein EPN18_02730 [bacterium]